MKPLIFKDISSAILYDEKSDGSVQFFLSGFSIMEILSELPSEYLIADLKLMASNSNMNYIYSEDLEDKSSIASVLKFFDVNNDYAVDNMDVIFQNRIEISIHDENEIEFLFPKETEFEKIINSILKRLEFNSKEVISKLIKNKNEYLLFERPNKLIKKYKSFEEYLESVAV